MVIGQNNQITAVLITKDKPTKEAFPWCEQIITINPKDDNADSRNQALKQAKSRWVLFLKNNELVSPELVKEITDFIRLADQRGYTGAQLIIKKSFLGHIFSHGGWPTKREIRLGRRVGEWTKKDGRLIWSFPGQKAILANLLIHQPYKNLAQLLITINRQTTNNAQKAYQKQKRCSILKVVFPPLAIFNKNFFFRFGFLDGLAGFVLAILEAFGIFLTNAKLWLLKQQNKNVRDDN